MICTKTSRVRTIQCGQEVAGQHDLEAADAVGERAEDDEEGHAQQEGAGDDEARLRQVELHRRLQERQRVELARVPDHALAGRRAEEDEQHDLEILPVAEALAQRRQRGLATRLEGLEERRLGERDADVERHRHEDEREQERDAPAPRLEVGVGHQALDRQDHAEGDEEAERGRDLDEARVVAAAGVGHVLGDVHRRAAVLAAEGQALEEAEHEEDRRREDADRRIRRQHADEERRQAHDGERDEERVLASDQIADAPEDDGPERPHDEARGEQRPRLDQRPRRIPGREHQRGHDHGQTSEDVEVVPLDHRAEAGGKDDAADGVLGFVAHAAPLVGRWSWVVGRNWLRPTTHDQRPTFSGFRPE
jgi:hypothetical protein